LQADEIADSVNLFKFKFKSKEPHLFTTHCQYQFQALCWLTSVHANSFPNSS